MSFHRFEDNAVKTFAPHLSTAQNHLVEGKYVYFNLNCKPAGTGSEPHYHPNELLVFCIRGRINALVGMERQIVEPGTFISVPPNARHSFKATEEADCAYLYIKDHTWGLVGVAADEAVPDEIIAVDKAHEMLEDGDLPDEKKGKGKSDIIIEGLSSCIYKLLDNIDQPIGQCNREVVMNSARVDFGLYEYPNGISKSEESSAHENFLYVLDGKMEAEVDFEIRNVGAGDIVWIDKGASYSLKAHGASGVRYAAVHSSSKLEEMVDTAPKVEAGAYNPR